MGLPHCHFSHGHVSRPTKNHMTAEITIHSPAILGYHPVPSGFWLNNGFIHHPLKRRPFSSGTVPLARWHWQLQSWTSKTAGATLGCIFKQTIGEYKTYLFMYIWFTYIYTYIYIHIHIHIYIYIYIYIHTFFHVCIVLYTILHTYRYNDIGK